jgi:general nucleoside transport system permease protein
VVWVVLLLLASGWLFWPNARQRAWGFYGLGAVGIALFALAAIWFYQSVAGANALALAEGAKRPPLRRFALSLGLYLSLFYAAGLLLLARLQLAGGKAFLVRLRGVMVPLVSLLIAVVMGAFLVAALRPGLGTEGIEAIGWREQLASKLDLVTYSYQLLFSPLLSLAGVFSSLAFATPLILSGLAVAFSFRAGLFNIGAPGQITLGAIFAMLVGIYMPGPAWIVLPLAVVAAAVGGGIWGGIVGWLKARFGANEVINTIMMNYIAAQVFWPDPKPALQSRRRRGQKPRVTSHYPYTPVDSLVSARRPNLLGTAAGSFVGCSDLFCAAPSFGVPRAGCCRCHPGRLCPGHVAAWHTHKT